jgi:hypothetical protein
VEVVDQGVFVRAWAVQTRRVAWLLGAGASAAAGLPTATQIRDDLLLRLFAERHGLLRENLHPNDPKVASDLREYFDGRNDMVPFGSHDDYSTAFELVFKDEPARHRYLRDKLKGKQPSYGQRVLGALVSGGQADVLVTTNFDELLERAAADAYAAVNAPADRRLLNTAALGSRDRARSVLEPDALPLLIKLHGDFRESALKNLAAELAEQDSVLLQAVNDLSRTYGLAVVGYSGRDDSVMSMLEAASDVEGAWPAGVWWFTREPDRTPKRVTELLERIGTAGGSAHLVQLGAFDELMGDLALQVQLPSAARAFVSQLRPQQRLTRATPPSSERTGYPVIRYNAVPILQAPTTALHAPFSGLDHHEFRALTKAQEFRGAVVMSGGSLWGWSDAEAFASLAAEQPGTKPETRDIKLTTAPVDPGVHALALEGITKALCSQLPTRPRSTRRENALLLTEFEDLDLERAEVLRSLRSAYDKRTDGTLNPQYGPNQHGAPRAYAEAVRLHLEHRWGWSWLIFTPFTWVERWERPEDQRHTPDPVNDWLRERWVGRKKNETWAQLIAAWTEAITPGRQETVVRMPRALGGATFGEFRLGNVSAYSRRAL